jgi:CcmD family protein
MSRRIAKLLALACFCGGIGLITPTFSASAQTEDAQDAKDAPGDRAASFQAVSGGVQEDVAGGPLMLLAYAAVWLVIFGYVYRINRLQRDVEANVERLERAIARQSTTTS